VQSPLEGRILSLIMVCGTEYPDKPPQVCCDARRSLGQIILLTESLGGYIRCLLGGVMQHDVPS
jgi:hypothetical protein